MNWTNFLTERYPDVRECVGDIERAFQIFRGCFRSGGKLLVCGNGGSASDAEHIVGELMKGYMLKRQIPPEIRQKLIENYPASGEYLAGHLQGALPAISLVSHSSLISAFANDVTADMVYAQQVYGYGRPGDVLLAISTSGNAKNVLYAVQVARSLGLHTVGLAGPSGGALKAECEVAICAPGSTTPEIQERHLPIYHALCAMLELEFFR